MEGIETLRSKAKSMTSPRVSRCPDMEGIETNVRWRFTFAASCQ